MSKSTLPLLTLLLVTGAAQAATLTVTHGNDSGAGSLRQALADANPSGDLIVFAGGVTRVALLSQLVIGKSTTIDGPGVTLDGQLQGRVLQVNAGVTATLRGLTLTRGLLAGQGVGNGETAEAGSSRGAGIRNDGTLTLIDVKVLGNYATGGGGGSDWGGGGGGSGVGLNIGQAGEIKGAGGRGGDGGDYSGHDGGPSSGGAGAIDTPGGGRWGYEFGVSGGHGGNGSSGGGAGGGISIGGGGGGGWRGGGGGAGGRDAGGGGGGYGGGGGGFFLSSTGGGSNGFAGGAGGDNIGGGGGGYGGSAAQGNDGRMEPGSPSDFLGGGGGYAQRDGIWVGGGGGSGGLAATAGGAAAAGIYNAPLARLAVQGTDCAITGNLAAGGGGAGYQDGGHAVGGLWNDGELHMDSACRTALSGNAAGAGRKGQGAGTDRQDANLRDDGQSLQVSVTGNGRVNASATPAPLTFGIANCTSAGGAACQAKYAPADTATLTATGSTGWHFTSWGGDCSGTSTCTVPMDQARSVTATFATNTYAITPSASPTAGGSAACDDATVPHGSGTTCTASAPNTGYTFTGFTGCTSQDVPTRTCTLSNVTGARSPVARYALNTYPITASASPAAGGTVTCPATAPHGASRTCTASTPNAGFTFTGFTGCNSTTGTACTLSNVTGPRTVVGEYAAITSFSGTTVPATGTGGPASASFTGGGASCRFDATATGFGTAGTTPAGKTAPQGAFRFKLIGCNPGSTVRVTTVWPLPVAGFTKYSRGTFLPASHFTISGHTVSFDVTDGGLGDDDGQQNGEIVDPAMPLAARGGATAIPTLGEWGLLMLSALLGALGWRRRSRSAR